MIRTNLWDHFGYVVELKIDKRWRDEQDVSCQMQLGKGPQTFLVGNGELLPKASYFHIDTDQPEGWKGTRQSYNYYLCLWKIIELAKQAGLKNFLFLEDDAWFQPNFDEVFAAGMAELHDKFYQPDMLYLGGNHHNSVTKLIAPHVLRCSCTLDMHAVAIWESMYDDILSLRDKPWLNENPYADVTIAHAFHAKHEVYCLYPSVVYQFEGYSHNEGKQLSRIGNWQHPGRLIAG